MNELQYKEHKLAEKAQRISEIKQNLQELTSKEEQLQAQKPTCHKDKLTYEESIEFGKKVDHYEEAIGEIEVKRLKLERQLSALELQAQRLMPVAGIKIRVSKYSNEGQPLQTFCVQQTNHPDHAGSESCILVEQV